MQDNYYEPLVDHSFEFFEIGRDLLIQTFIRSRAEGNANEVYERDIQSNLRASQKLDGFYLS